jgi:hypothetical protein
MYRISDESFCRQPLSHSQQVTRRYTALTLVNFTIIGFVGGVVISFIVYYVQKLSSIGKNEDDKLKRRLRKIEKERDAEAIMAADISF